MLPPISIVMPSWRGRKLLEKSIPAILATQYPNFEFLLVENGIADDTSDFLCTISDTRLRHIPIKENKGYAAGVNLGVSQAQHEIVAVICNDNQPHPDWLKLLTTTLLNNPKAGAVMAQSTLTGMRTELRGTLNLWARNIQFNDERIFKEPVPIFYPGGNAFIFNKKILSLPFDPDYFTYGEDVYLGWRLNNLGYTSYYCHQAIVDSFDGGTTKRTPFRTAFRSERNRWLNLLIFPQLSTLFILFPLWMLDFLINLVLGKNKIAKIFAPIWLLINIPFILKKRRPLQNERNVKDQNALLYMSYFYHPKLAFLNSWIGLYLRIFGLKNLGVGLR